MSTRQKRESRFSGFIVPCLCAAILGYFAYHAQTGRYSIHTKTEMHEEKLRLKSVLAELTHEREQLQRRVDQLTVGSLEKDALDEAARSQLGLSAPGELVILYNPI